jgi:hypothetical protein
MYLQVLLYYEIAFIERRQLNVVRPFKNAWLYIDLKSGQGVTTATTATTDDAYLVLVSSYY